MIEARYRELDPAPMNLADALEWARGSAGGAARAVALILDPQADLDRAERFGREVRERLLAASSIDEVPEVSIPGCRPYRGDPTLWQVDFIAVGPGCTR